METINNSALHHGERLTLLSYFIEILKSYESPERPDITELINYIQIFYDNLAKSIQHERAHHSSKEIKRLRKLRKNSILSFRRGIKEFSKKPDQTRREAAELLQPLWNKAFSELNIESSSETSAGTDIFLSLLDDAVIESALEKLTFDIDREYLTDTQLRLKKLVENRAIDEEQDNTPNLLECSIEIGHLFIYIKERLHMKVILGDEPYQEIIIKLNGRIGEIMAAARSRQTFAENKKRDEEGEMNHTVEDVAVIENSDTSEDSDE